MTGIYIHVPFCRTICPYCDFVKRPIKGAAPDEFIHALAREIETYDGDRHAETIFFGGGTPSLLAPKSLAAILDALHLKFRIASEVELTLEANPDDITQDLLDHWKALGVNRVSLGVQSFDQEALRYLGRRHDADGARRACGLVAASFPNWNMDLMFGPHPVTAYPATLAECATFAPPHVSAYGLTYEAGTPFGKRSHEAIDEDTYLRLYALTGESLRGLDRYEVSNYARPGFECRHNLRYWHNDTYAGFGPAAYSFLEGVRARNHVKLEEYLANPGGKCEALNLTRREVQVETVIQYLRLREGLPAIAYERRFGTSLLADFGGVLRALVGRGLLEEVGHVFRPTAAGFELNNEIGLALVDAPAR
ncbi:MAG: radical SAM family heme chaperone HemW [Candidatus Hydrogenedentes bacterium]|nr:radical SAM family heme chaperone HemW [Candidatus Hydrogenedentota bacterium]